MDRVILGIGRDGTIRAIDSPDLPLREVLPGATIFRASSILPIPDQESRYCGWYYADMSPLADAERNDAFRICLIPPQPTYSAARQQEEQWLMSNFVSTNSSVCGSMKS